MHLSLGETFPSKTGAYWTSKTWLAFTTVMSTPTWTSSRPCDEVGTCFERKLTRGHTRDAVSLMATLEEFLARAIVPGEFLLALDLSAPDTELTLAKTLETLRTLNEDFEESTMPGGKPGWFAMSSLMKMSIAFCKESSERSRQHLVEAVLHAREHT